MEVAAAVAPVVEGFLGSDLPIAIRFWDGSALGPPDAATAIVMRSPNALRRLLYAPNELGLGRAYVAGDIDLDGNVFDLLAVRDRMGTRTDHVDLTISPKQWVTLARAARSLGALGRPLPPPPEEARLAGKLHSRRRDSDAISHHYDVSNDFYRIVLGNTMTYSCAYWARDPMTLDDAQEAKYELICKKLGLRSGMRLLDVGCGWGGMLLHAARHHDVEGVGITLSRPQADLAAKRVAEEGLAERIEIRVQDYRDVPDGPFDAISSIGMFEHVGLSALGDYFSSLNSLLKTRGRLLNHAISRPPGAAGLDKHSFIARYVFPDGELHEVGAVISAMQAHGFEVRDVESLREHYALTLREWVANLEAHWDEAVSLVGAPRARIWRLYMAGSALMFEAGRINIHQTLGVKPDGIGTSAMAPTRAEFLS